MAGSIEYINDLREGPRILGGVGLEWTE